MTTALERIVRAVGERKARPPEAQLPAVLLVDDNPNNLLAMEGMLRRDDIEILTAPSGRAALEVLLAREVAVAIIDVQMPEMDGFELASLMRGVEKTRYVPIIFVTAGSRDSARVFKGYEAGAVDYLFKPVDPQVLQGKVDVFVTLERHRQQLREAERMRETFMAVLGHDLRNPLTGILMTAKVLARRATSDDVAVPAQRIVRNGERIKRLIEQLLDATRFRATGGVALCVRSADLRTLTEQIVDELQLDSSRVHLEVAGCTEGSWDVDRMLQVLSNLIGNAVHHSPEDSPIDIRIDGRDDQQVELRVHNGGPPIPDELRPVLFLPFQRFDRRRRDEGEGLGLGLFITQQLVQAHGGAIAFESTAGEGTTFIVTLARHAPDSGSGRDG